MIVNYKGKKAKLPDFFIVGATKSGTTSLHYYLKQHPNIFMPKVKELGFITFLDAPSNLIRNNSKRFPKFSYDFSEYIRHFSRALNNQVIGEACPLYLYAYKDAIRNLRKIYRDSHKDLKIIIILRNPPDRAWSHFMERRRDGEEPLTNFKDALKVPKERLGDSLRLNIRIDDYIAYGMYFDQVNAYTQEFQYVKIFLYDELCKDALKLIKEIFLFLGVDEGFIPDMKIRYNISGESKFNLINALMTKEYPLKVFLRPFIPCEIRGKIRHKILEKNMLRKEMPGEIRKELINLYKNDILKLQKLINKDLSLWL